MDIDLVEAHDWRQQRRQRWAHAGLADVPHSSWDIDVESISSGFVFTRSVLDSVDLQPVSGVDVLVTGDGCSRTVSLVSILRRYFDGTRSAPEPDWKTKLLAEAQRTLRVPGYRNFLEPEPLETFVALQLWLSRDGVGARPRISELAGLYLTLLVLKAQSYRVLRSRSGGRALAVSPPLVERVVTSIRLVRGPDSRQALNPTACGNLASN